MNTHHKKNYFLLFFVSVISIYLSTYLSSKYFKLDGDTINSALVWSEFQNDGISAIRNWIPTEDNWYLSVYPIHFIIYMIFGWKSINSLIAISSIQVFACAFLSFLIVKKISNSIYSIIIIPALCALPYLCYEIGFISHPFSHNTSNLYGLILIYINTLARNRFTRSLISSAIILIAGISDPWFIAAYGLPALLHSILVDINERSNRFIPSICLLLALLIYFSQAIQKCLEVPASHFHLANFDAIKSNVYWYIYAIGGMINISYEDSDALRFASFSIVMLLGLYGMIKMYSSGKREISFLLLMSAAGISGAYILGLPEKQYYSARFLVNIIYIYYITSFFVISSENKAKFIYFISVFLVATSSFIGHTQKSNDNLALAAEQQLKFMDENDLKYGFGPYWSGNPNVISWLSKGEIDFNPIIFRSDNGFLDWATPRAQSFRDKIQPKKKKTFIMISSDGESCKDIDICIGGIKEQYGAPDRIIGYNESFFYVYNHGLKQVN